VHYTEVETAVRDLVSAADDEHRRRFGAATIGRLTTVDGLAADAEIEFDEDARQAFTEACANPANSTPNQLHAWLARIEAGTVSDGDMDQPVLRTIMALEHWAGYLTDHKPEFIAELAIRSLEEVDLRAPADYHDFLRTPEMAAEFDRIARLLR
jgi:hypothetical protein